MPAQPISNMRPPGRARRLLAIALAALLWAPVAIGQEPPSDDGGATSPFDESLLRLSEILGAVHYLRQLCSSGDGPLWRDQMQALLDAEQPDDDRRARYVDRFNRGYDSFRSVYRTCTPAARLAIDRYLQEGADIARDVAARYGTDVP